MKRNQEPELTVLEKVGGNQAQGISCFTLCPRVSRAITGHPPSLPRQCVAKMLRIAVTWKWYCIGLRRKTLLSFPYSDL